ncbi:MAG TPA: fatty acyl-AMP ligase [Microthrixaceae bacterium]|nr:fatty acyl-AMP ligase [Microthrixaceae bacterium]HNI35223.1 fatty acyl-AMP ligase [Microthrixaceae bacterium]
MSERLTLPERIEHAATLGGTVTFIDGDSHETITWAELHHDARVFAAGLQARGVGEGDHVAIMGPTTRDLVTTIQAVWLAGGVLVMLPLPMRMGSLEQFIEQTRDRIRFAKVGTVVLDPQLAEFIEHQPGDPTFLSYADLSSESTGQVADDWKRPTPDPDALAVLQFTSGSTSEPKGVMLAHRQLCANIDGCYSAAQMTLDDTVVSWLPLYHDMGLIGLLTIPMTSGAGLVQGAPQDFLSKPARWMQWVSELDGTITAGPNFSFALARRALNRAEGLDLSRLRICLNGAEPIDCEGFREFLDAGARFGMDPNAAFPAFGMAEVCIAGTFPVPGSGLQTDVVDGHALEHDHVATPVAPGTDGARELAKLGFAIPGLEFRVVAPDSGEVLGDRQVGELQIRGTSLTLGYYERPDATDALFDGDWLHTGDLAYQVDGQIVMCGRIKDVIIIGGRNIYPQDIEQVVGRIDQVRTGNVIAFGEEGAHAKQHIVVVAETRTEDPVALRKAIGRSVTEDIGVPPREVVLVAPGTVPKTSSGKLQRSACRQMLRSGELVGL